MNDIILRSAKRLDGTLFGVVVSLAEGDGSFSAVRIACVSHANQQEYAVVIQGSDVGKAMDSTKSLEPVREALIGYGTKKVKRQRMDTLLSHLRYDKTRDEIWFDLPRRPHHEEQEEDGDPDVLGKKPKKAPKLESILRSGPRDQPEALDVTPPGRGENAVVQDPGAPKAGALRLPPYSIESSHDT